MRTLAIDTSHAAGSVAAGDGGRLSTRPLGATGAHAGLLVERLTEAAREIGWELSEAQLVAVIRGPGSFTGLRVGLTTAKAIAWAGGLKLVGVSGFEAVALETARLTGWQTLPLEIAFDAGRGEVYAARVAPSDATPTGWLVGPTALAPVADWLAGLPAGAPISGPALQLHADLFTAAGHRLAPTEGWFPTAAAAAALAPTILAAGAADDPHTLLPEYLRPSYADEGPRPARATPGSPG